MKTILSFAVVAIAGSLAFAQEITPSIAISVIGKTNNAAGRSFVILQVTNAAAKPYYFVYQSMVPSGSGWIEGKHGWLNEGSYQILSARTATNFSVRAPQESDRWRVKLRFNLHRVTQIEQITHTEDIITSNVKLLEPGN